MAGPDVERRRLLVVERAEPLHRPGTGPAQREVLADDLVDPDAVADLRDVAVPDPARHGEESRRARRRPDAPPSTPQRHLAAVAGPRSNSEMG
jgi:hypothetical protein